MVSRDYFSDHILILCRVRYIHYLKTFGKHWLTPSISNIQSGGLVDAWIQRQDVIYKQLVTK